jgi:hypothetical protein
MNYRTENGGPAFPDPAPGEDGHLGMTLRDYLMAHAPPMPQVIFDAYLECYQTNEGEHPVPLWNEGALRAFAFQEARWRAAYASEVLRERENYLKRQQSTQEPTP